MEFPFYNPIHSPGDHSLIFIIYQNLSLRWTQSYEYLIAIIFMRDAINKSELFTKNRNTTEGVNSQIARMTDV